MKLLTTQEEYLLELRELWTHTYLEECARISDEKPYMSSMDIERMAAGIATKAMYYSEKDELDRYKISDFWRLGLE